MNEASSKRGSADGDRAEPLSGRGAVQHLGDSRPGKVLLACYHAYPDHEVGARRVSELANYLCGRGWQVTLLSGQFEERQGADVLVSGVRAVRLARRRSLYDRVLRHIVPSWLRGSKAPLAGHHGVPGSVESSTARPKVIEWCRTRYHELDNVIDDYKSWSFRAGLAAFKEIRKSRPDLIVCSGPPFSIAVVIGLIARWYGLKLIVDMRDPWSDRVALGFATVSRLPLLIDRKCEALTLAAASVVVTTTQAFRDRLVARYPGDVAGKIVVVRNGFDPIHRVQERAPVDILRFLFAGTIYFNRNPVPFLSAVRRALAEGVLSKGEVRVDLVGDCRRWGEVDLQSLVNDMELGSVVFFRDRVSQAELRTLVANSNVLLNFSQGQKEQVPAKLFEQIASGRMILVFCESDSETARIVSGYDRAWVVSDDASEVFSAVAELYRRLREPGIDASHHGDQVDDFSRARCVVAFERYLTKVVDGCRSYTESRDG